MIAFEHILCPIDLSELSLRPLAHAAALARWYDAQLTVLHVVPSFDPIQIQAGTLGDPVRHVQPLGREEILRELHRALAVAGVAAPHVSLLAESGDPVATIVDRAVALPADLLVIGTHGRSGFDRWLLGSVTEKVLRKVPCPVLTVPPHAGNAPQAEVTFRRILCPMDFSPSAMQALGFALDLARQANGAVTVLHVLEWLTEWDPRPFGHLDVSTLRDRLMEEAHERMHALVAEESRTWCEIREAVTFGRAHREILRVAEADGSELIAMGAQGRGATGLLFGSATEQVVRAATCPVLTVRTTSA